MGTPAAMDSTRPTPARGHRAAHAASTSPGLTATTAPSAATTSAVDA